MPKIYKSFLLYNLFIILLILTCIYILYVYKCLLIYYARFTSLHYMAATEYLFIIIIHFKYIQLIIFLQNILKPKFIFSLFAN